MIMFFIIFLEDIVGELNKALFGQTSAISLPIPPMQDIIVDAIESCPIDIRKDLYGNVIVSGGNTLWENYLENMCVGVLMTRDNSTNCITATAKKDFCVGRSGLYLCKVLTDTTMGDSTIFDGLSILTSLSSAQNFWVTKGMYEEIGRYCAEHRM